MLVKVVFLPLWAFDDDLANINVDVDVDVDVTSFKI